MKTIGPNPENGETIEALDTMYPSLIRAVKDATYHESKLDRHTYGYVVHGKAVLVAPGKHHVDEHILHGGAWFSVPGNFTIQAETGLVYLIQRIGYRGIKHIGRLETQGRLSYIDGCSDTLLAAPARRGDPCFNHLHFPPGIHQSQHTHPSVRLGVVTNGKGEAFQTKDGTKHGEEEWSKPLEPGIAFLLEEQEQHSFRTIQGNDMDVVAYHPDSDWGPEDENHPMLNRTYLK